MRSSQNPFLPGLLALFFLVGGWLKCQSPKKPPTPLLIEPGRGPEATPLNAPTQQLIAHWGRSGINIQGRSIRQSAKGWEAIITPGGKIQFFIAYFNEPTFQDYPGKIAGGLGAASTVAAVKKAYGPPHREKQRILSPTARYPGASEVTLDYGPRGIRFVFINDRLTQAQVFPPIPAKK